MRFLNGIHTGGAMNVWAFSALGYEGCPVQVECDIQRGLPGFSIVGLGGSAVQESRQRVQAALISSGFRLPSSKILINLSPASLVKEGASFDLAVAMAVLVSSGQIELGEDDLRNVLFIGELGLRGDIRPTDSDCAALLSESAITYDKIVLSSKLRDQVKRLPIEELSIDFVSDLSMVVERIRFGRTASHCVTGGEAEPAPVCVSRLSPPPPIDRETLLAMTVAAVGMHNVLLFGPPGSGKTTAARFLELLIPEQTRSVKSEQYRIHVRSPQKQGPRNKPFELKTFREPHHNSSAEGVLGGGKALRPGELSLAHGGVLLMDEAPEFHRNVLQSLREPMEQGRIDLIRAQQCSSYPCAASFVFTMNLCPCGNRGRSDALCMCSESQIQRYWSQLGGALYDRIEIRRFLSGAAASQEVSQMHCTVPPWFERLFAEHALCNSTLSWEVLSVLSDRIGQARNIQRDRYGNHMLPFNSYAQFADIESGTEMGNGLREHIQQIAEQEYFSHRQLLNMLRLALSIGDLRNALSPEAVGSGLRIEDILLAKSLVQPKQYGEYL